MGFWAFQMIPPKFSIENYGVSIADFYHHLHITSQGPPWRYLVPRIHQKDHCKMPVFWHGMLQLNWGGLVIFRYPKNSWFSWSQMFEANHFAAPTTSPGLRVAWKHQSFGWRLSCFLVGGWTTHLKNISQTGNLPQIGVEIKNNYLKPPPSFDISKCIDRLQVVKTQENSLKGPVEKKHLYVEKKVKKPKKDWDDGFRITSEIQVN